MRPWSSTISRSMRAMVESRCAIAITVLPAISVPRPDSIAVFTLPASAAGGLVEHQDRRVLEDRARDRDPLALAAGELDAALADLRRVALALLPVLELEDELVRVGELRRGDDLGLGRLRAAVADVVADRAV